MQNAKKEISIPCLPRNETLPAGSPMFFSCEVCGWPIVVPENYVFKPARCTICGGEWSQLVAPVTMP